MAGRQLRSATGTGTGVKLNNTQKLAMLGVFNNDQDLCDVLINVIESGAALVGGGGATVGPTIAPAQVYTNNYALYKHSWTNAQGK